MIATQRKAKKIAYVLLVLLILPIALLFGCGETNSFFVQVYSSGSGVNPSGGGTYDEGSKVTLTAKSSSSVTSETGGFIGWVKENETLLADDVTYSISNTTAKVKVADGATFDSSKTYYTLSSSDGKTYNEANIEEFVTGTTYYVDVITKSVLSFTASATTQGTYTAVFDDGKVEYVQLTGVEFEAVTQTSGSEDSDFAGLTISSFVLSEGETVFTSVIDSNDTEQFMSTFSETSLALAIASNNSVLQLAWGTTKLVRINMSLSVETNNATTLKTYTLIAGMQSATSTDFETDEDGNVQDGVYQEIATTSGTYHVEYASGVYEVVFTFDVSGSEYLLTLTYETL